MTTIMNIKDQDTIQKTPHDLLLDKYKVGYTWKLNNIHYDFDKSFIRKDARPILDSLVKILNTYPINVELGSHTDCRGSNEYNIALSQRRADAAVAYLISNGIDSRRIKARGYGETQLLNKCSDGVPCSKEAHQENRRTEVKVTSLNIPQPKSSELDLDKFKAGEVIDKDQLPNNFFDNCK
jgi:outer membrane protein OmpA-like peptidoglycan-associated protein